jgi:hypothetical protein
MHKAGGRPDLAGIGELVTWIAETWHEGSYYPIAERLGTSTAVVYQWRDSLTKSPRVSSIYKLSTAYGLDPHWAMDVVMKVPPTKPKLPPRSDKSRARAKRAIAGMILASAVFGAVAHGSDAYDKRYYVNRKPARPLRRPLYIDYAVA